MRLVESRPRKNSSAILEDLDEWQDEKKVQYAKEAEEAEATKGKKKNAPEQDDKGSNKRQKTEGKEDADHNGKKESEFRNYVDSQRQARVQKFYTEQHKGQTVEFNKKMREKYLPLDKLEMGVWEAIEYLDSLVDESDPDTDASQLQHALQTAESIRKDYPGEDMDWFPVTGLIHDLGKILSVAFKEPQWATVGDTFPVGCKFVGSVFQETFEANPDFKHKIYSTENGIYKPGCGLSNLTMSWGHDEYLYQVCVKNKSKLPIEALYMIRYHSFYPWHKSGAYKQFEDEQDKKNLEWVLTFNKYDLYSKADPIQNVEELKAYYKKKIDKYFPTKKLKW